MANSFEDILESIKDDSIREVIKKEAESNPALKGGWLRQAEFSRKLNELDGKAKYADAWETWKKENWDDGLKMTKAEAEAQQRIREMEAENETLRQLQGDSDVTFEQLQSEVDKMVTAKTKGALTEEQFNQKYGTKLFDKAAYDKEVNERVTNWTAARDNMYLQMYELGFKHKDEFGEILKPADVIKYANENKIQDLEEAHNRMVAPRRTEKQNKDMELKLEAARKEGETKAKQEMAMSSTGRMPTDAGAPEMSHLQQRLLRGTKEGSSGYPG